MKKYLWKLVPVLTIEVEAENLHEAKDRAFFHSLGQWNWDATREEAVQQQNPDGSWGPVEEDA